MEEEGQDQQIKTETNFNELKTPRNDNDKCINVQSPARPPPEIASVSFVKLYSFASKFDIVLLAAGTCLAIVHGALFPTIGILFGEAIATIGKPEVDLDRVSKAALNFVYIAIGLFLSGSGYYFCFVYTAERQMNKLRSACIRHVLIQEIAWFDQIDAGELASRISGDTEKIKEAMGDKLGEAIKVTSQFAIGYTIGFSKGWNISLAMAGVMPFMAICMGYLLIKLKHHSIWAQKVYAEAGAIAEETIASIRTIASLNGEERAARIFQKRLLKAEKQNIKLAVLISVAIGWFMGLIWIIYGIGLWYGGYLVSSQTTMVRSPQDVLGAFYSILIGTISLSQISPNISAIANGKGAAVAIFNILERKSKIDSSSLINSSLDSDNEITSAGCGRIEAINIDFSYPSRPDVKILQKYNLLIKGGETVALVGPSGGGKSTLVSLLERMYDPIGGEIQLDGRNIRDIPVRCLRSQIGLVSQEPVLFSGTIFKNISYGLNSEQATFTQVEQAAKLANAHEFILRLPEQYNTLVGEAGSSLSGGQKQRIAIARALIRQPKILILDEATSALDSESERTVQVALNSLMEQNTMTVIVIAHRLSTIRNADQIVVVSSGAVVEKGSHEELVEFDGGIYRSMLHVQNGTFSEFDQSSNSKHPEKFNKIRVEDSMLNTPSNECLLNAATEKKMRTSYLRIFGLNDEGKFAFFSGICASMLNGFSLPTSSFLISGIIIEMTKSYNLFVNEKDSSHLNKLYDNVEKYGILYLGGSIVIFAINFIQAFSFKYLGEKLISKLRDMNFRALIRQEVGFFDEKCHSTGALTSELATNPTKVVRIAGENQGRLLQCIFMFSAAVIISFTFGSWKLSLVILLVFPILICSQILKVALFKKDLTKGAEGMQEAGACASEAISNIRTVAAYGIEGAVVKDYEQCLSLSSSKFNKDASWSAFATGFGSFTVFSVYALVFWYGGGLVKNDEISFSELMRSLMAIMMSAQGIGQVAGFMGDTTSAKEAATQIFAIVDRQPKIDNSSSAGSTIDCLEGNLEFLNVKFCYPTRPNSIVLDGYNLSVKAGQTVALCGPSGGGKSTIVSLLERFYNPIEGRILVDGMDIQKLNVKWMRQQIGMVGQEPVLFAGTIAENIAYNTELAMLPSDDEDEEITRKKKSILDQVYDAAKSANVHDFVMNFPLGYNTQVGVKGSQLSGGQKQRIAIARAIFNDPKILLLDEATSALDSESECIVQKSLDSLVAMRKRTTIIIAHRLSTIRNADKICVVCNGQVVEEGPHLVLLKENGIYSKLVNQLQ